MRKHRKSTIAITATVAALLSALPVNAQAIWRFQRLTVAQYANQLGRCIPTGRQQDTILSHFRQDGGGFVVWNDREYWVPSEVRTAVILRNTTQPIWRFTTRICPNPNTGFLESQPLGGGLVK